MKKSIKKILLGLSCLFFLFFTACTSIKTRTEYVNEYVVNSKMIDIIILRSSTDRLIVSIVNNTSNVIEIDWNSSSLSNSSLFMDGQKYSNAGKMVPSTPIPPKGEIIKDISRAQDVWFSEYSGWNIKELDYPAEIIIKANSNNKSEYEVVKIYRYIIPLE